MFRHVEASIVGDQVWLWLRVPMPKMPPDTKVCGPPCCCLPGCNYVAFPLFMQGMKGTVKPIYDVSMDAIEDDFRQRRLAAPLDAGGGVMTLPVFAAELPIAQVIAVVPIQMIQVVTTTTTITGDPMTGEQWVTTQQTDDYYDDDDVDGPYRFSRHRGRASSRGAVPVSPLARRMSP